MKPFKPFVKEHPTKNAYLVVLGRDFEKEAEIELSDPVGASSRKYIICEYHEIRATLFKQIGSILINTETIRDDDIERKYGISLSRKEWNNLNRIKKAKQKIQTYIVGKANKPNKVKIGRSVNVPKRLKSIEGSSGDELYLIKLFDKDVEGQLHKRYKTYRDKIGEWFNIPNMDKFISELEKV